MKKSILLSIIFSLEILFSMPKAEAIDPVLKHIVFLSPILISHLIGREIKNSLNYREIADQAYFGKTLSPEEIRPSIETTQTGPGKVAIEKADQRAERNANKILLFGVLTTVLAYGAEYVLNK